MSLKLVTVFGGSGFIGRHVVQRLAAQGLQVRVAVRDPEGALFCKPMGDVGQVTPIQANIRNVASVKAAIKGADAVINLVGIMAEGGRQKFDTVQAIGAANIAKAAADAGVKKLVHISAIGADVTSKAPYARSKAAGEAGVLAAFPTASILRPSVVFGPQDRFFNKFGNMTDTMPFLPLIDGGTTKFQPVYVGDVADAVMTCLNGDAQQEGKVFELAGPNQYTFRDVMEMVLDQCDVHRGLVPLPSFMLMPVAWMLDWLPFPMPITVNQLQFLKADNVASGDLPGLSDLGITATSAELILPSYMVSHRQGGQYNASSA